jgi:hypothetical protein
LQERPVVSALGANLGAQAARNDQGLGPLPSFLEGAIKIGHLPGFMGPLEGRTALWDTKSLNPFATGADLLKLFGSGHVSDEIAGSLNPIVRASIEQLTGTSLLTGAPMRKSQRGKNLPGMALKVGESAFSVPQLALAEALLGGTPNRPGSLYRSDWQSQLAAILGARIKKTNISTAQGEAARGR